MWNYFNYLHGPVPVMDMMLPPPNSKYILQRWYDKTPALLTVSKVPRLNTRSVVAATLPPFRCKSHMISRREIWGNICEICSTSAGFAVRDRGEAVDEEAGVKKKYRTARAERAARRRRDGMDSVCCCWSDIAVERVGNR